jgi:hypothetical protein
MTTTTARDGRAATPRSRKPAGVAVPHLSVADRVARGKAARAQSRVRLTRGLSRHRRELIRVELLEFSKAYAEQNERDYRALAAAVDSGELVARTGL